MQLAGQRAEPDHDEGIWAYLSVGEARPDDIETLRDGLVELCQRHGLSLYQQRTGNVTRQLDAIGEAVAVIVDVSEASPQLAAELAAAHCGRRPVIALRHCDAEPSAVIDALSTPKRVRTVIWSDPADCVTQVESTLADPGWQQQLRAAILAQEPA